VPDLSLLDLITPYILRGAGFGPWQPALTVLSVDEHETAVSSEGVVIRGVVHFKTDIRPNFDPSRMVLGVEAEHEENHPLNDASRRDPWFDLRDLSIEFQLTVPRTQSQKVVQAVQQINANPNLAPAFAPAAPC